MATRINDPFSLSLQEIQRLLAARATALPELEAARADLHKLAAAPQARWLLEETAPVMRGIASIPETRYTSYRRFMFDGDRREYETPYFLKRSRLGAAAVRMALGEEHYEGMPLRNLIHDYLWSICEESSWVVPAHENRIIDLFAAETGFALAETLHLLGNQIDAEVRVRVRTEIERRIFDPYMRFHHLNNWYMGHNNWNGVCNSSVAATFLLLDPEPERVARALTIALAGLRVFLNTAFEADGSSTEGVSYWHYGMINFVALAEILQSRSDGAIDLLDSQHVRNVAAYPAKMQLSGSWFASFSDCGETVTFNPGIVARLAERTGERSLWNLLARPAAPKTDWRLPMMLRNLLWWDGSQPDAAAITDAVLPVGGTARLVGQAPDGTPVVLAIKAGHNAENHNQNDVGSFIVHVDGENLLTDPGRGLYNRFYFGPQRYENVFANSYGHSVPRIGEQLQAAGREYAGELIAVETGGQRKYAEVEFARAYPVEGLNRLRRRLSIDRGSARAGTIELEDEIVFAGIPVTVEEALITWHPVEVNGATALIRGERHSLRVTIEQPEGAIFELEELEEQSRANNKPEVLKRLRFVLPRGSAVQARVRMEVVA